MMINFYICDDMDFVHIQNPGPKNLSFLFIRDQSYQFQTNGVWSS